MAGLCRTLVAPARLAEIRCRRKRLAAAEVKHEDGSAGGKNTNEVEGEIKTCRWFLCWVESFDAWWFLVRTNINNIQRNMKRRLGISNKTTQCLPITLRWNSTENRHVRMHDVITTVTK